MRPDTGRLTGPDAGPGRLPDPAELFAVAVAVLADPSIAVRAASQDMAGLKVVVSAGGTREHLDPVRFIGNSSSGLMGWALARAAVLRGADVRLVAANVGLPAPPGTEVEAVSSTADLAQAMAVAAKDADIAIMAAAPADFTPASASQTKIKKSADGGLELRLVQTTDVLASLVAARTDARQILVGFAAETPGARRDTARPGPCQARAQGLRPAGTQRGRPQSGLRPTRKQDHPADRGGRDRADRRKQGHACASNLG